MSLTTPSRLGATALTSALLAVGLVATSTAATPAASAAPVTGASVRSAAATTLAGTSASAVRRRAVDVRVGTFNLQSVSLDRSRGAQRPWKQRRGRVVSQVLRERIDVLGVQEANPSSYFRNRLVSGRNQYLDLRNGLNRAGGHYRLTNAHSYNCVDSRTSWRCRYRYRGASNSDRILFDNRKLRMTDRGSVRYRAHSSSQRDMYLTWAVLRPRAGGRPFVFVSTHLDPRNRDVRRAQWRQLIGIVQHLRKGRPVVVVGDFNTQKFDPLARTMLPAMKRAGFGDVLNQRYRQNPTRGIRARRLVNGWVNSYNHLQRNVAAFGYEDARRKTGNSIDYVFASNPLPVRDYKVVVDYDPRTLRVAGTLPSDHNMVRATLRLG